jgi:hypothetical protein
LGNLQNYISGDNGRDNDNIGGSSNGWLNTGQRCMVTVYKMKMYLRFKLK